MAELTREQIEYWRNSWAKKDTPIFGADFDELVALCDMAIRAIPQSEIDRAGDVVPKTGHCLLDVPQNTPCAMAGCCLATTSKAGDAVAVICNHDPFEGRCVHCDIRFIDGEPTILRCAAPAAPPDFDPCAPCCAPAALPKAGEAVAVSRDWPHEQTHQHVCEKCGQEYKGWQRSASCYACYVKYYAPCAAPAALPEEPTDAMAMAIYGALQSSGTDGWKYLATHQREKYMRAARALLSAAQGAEK